MLKFIFFEEERSSPGTWRAINRKSRNTVAMIWFDPGWKKWVWQMYPEVQFDEDCTKDILICIERLKEGLKP